MAQRLCQSDRKGGRMCVYFRPRGNEPDHRNRDGIYGQYPDGGDHRTGQHGAAWQGCVPGGRHHGAVESFVKYSYIVKNVEDIPRVFKEAFYIANTGRRGPVLIDVPIDVQNAKFDFSYPESVSLRTYKPTVKGHIIQIKKVIAELSKAKMPLICVGGGVLLSEARDEVRAFAEKYQIPVVSTMMGISTMPTEHPLYFGMVGNNGKAYANRAMNECDLLIVMGARLADRAIQQLNMNALAEERTVVHIDVDPAEIGKIMGPTIPIVGDIRHIMNDFAKQDFENDFSDWLQLLNMWKKEMAPKRRRIRNTWIRQSLSAFSPRSWMTMPSMWQDSGTEPGSGPQAITS